MIVTFTDFGVAGPYVGQMHGVLAGLAPAVPVIDLMRDAPAFDPRASAYLLASLIDPFPEGTVFLCVVDPGVGGHRSPIVVNADNRWYVGPGNGLFEMVIRRSASPVRIWRIVWRPERLSATFHGRDLFAPVAAMLAAGDDPDKTDQFSLLDQSVERRPDWSDDWPVILYIDGYGNAVTGLRASALGAGAELSVAGRTVGRARTFSDAGVGGPIFYENSMGLIEIAVNQGRADRELGLNLGSKVLVRNP